MEAAKNFKNTLFRCSGSEAKNFKNTSIKTPTDLPSPLADTPPAGYFLGLPLSFNPARRMQVRMDRPEGYRPLPLNHPWIKE